MLSAGISAAFSGRGLAVPAEPMALTPAFAADALKRTQWQAFLRKSQLESATKELVAVVHDLSAFLRPVLQALAAGSTFDDLWDPRGPWRKSSV